MGGIASYMLNLTKQLSKRGCQCVIYFESTIQRTEYIDGTKIVYLKSRGGKYLNMVYISLIGTIRALLCERKVNVFHYNNGFMLPLFGWLIKVFSPRAKIVIQTHSFAWKNPKYGKRIKSLIMAGEQFSVFFFRHFVVVNSEQQTLFRKLYGKKAKVIHSAVNEPQLTGSDAILSQYGLESNRYFLFIGRLDRIKNIDVLIKAFNLSGIRSHELVIAGANDSDPKYVEYLHSVARDNSNIIFTGAIYGEEKEALVRNCLAACLISSSEGLPISLLEAMSYGKICITSDIPGNREAIGDESLWVQPGDVNELVERLQEIILSSEKFKLMREKNKQRVLQYYTWDKISDIYLQYVNSLIK